jgi:hypothetical protein
MIEYHRPQKKQGPYGRKKATNKRFYAFLRIKIYNKEIKLLRQKTFKSSKASETQKLPN